MHTILVMSLHYLVKHKDRQEILLDCDQSNVLLARIIFFCILLRAFLFLSACIKDPASNLITNLIVTGVEVVIGNCLPEVHKILPILGTERKIFPIMIDDASCHLSLYLNA